MEPEEFAVKQWEELEKWLRAVYIAGYKAGAENAKTCDVEVKEK